MVVKGKRYIFKYWPEDDKYKPQETVLVVNKLIFTDKVKFMFGPMGAAGALAAGPICERNKVFNIANGVDNSLTLPGKNTYTVRTMGFIPKLLSGALVSKFKEVFPSLKTIGAIYVDDVSGQSAYADAKSHLESAGYRIIETVSYPRGTKEQRPVVTRALSKKPDAIWLLSVPPEDMAVQVKEIRLMGFKGPVWSTGDVDPRYLQKIAGVEASEGFVGSYFDPVGEDLPPQMVEYGRRYLNKYPEGWSNSGEIFYTAAFMLKRAMEIANSIDPTAVRDVFLREDVEWPTLFGPAFMKDREILRPIYFAVIKEGKAVNILAYPPGYPESKKKK